MKEDELRVVIFARSSAWHGIYCRYMASELAVAFPSLTVVLIDEGSTAFKLERARGVIRRWRRRGIRRFASDVRLRPARQRSAGEMAAVIEEALTARGAPAAPPVVPIVHCATVNGPGAVRALASLAPDVLIQMGAGILRSEVFAIPRLGTLNVHHGVLPYIRGADSILWAVHDGRRDWLGVSIHLIDRGIDTGAILARRALDCDFGVHPGVLYAIATAHARSLLIDVIKQLAAGTSTTIVDNAPGCYRSFFPPEAFAVLKANAWLPIHPTTEHGRHVPS